jgi:hypothetical protein
MKTKRLSLLFIFALLVIFNSCTKEQTEQTIDIPVKNEMLVFKTIEEYSAAIEKTIAFNHEELVAWEDAQGFKSYGRICEEIYFSINFELFNSFDEIRDVVKKNNQYLTLVKDDNDEYVLEHFLYNNPSRYIINSDRMFQIKDNVYKVFEKAYAYTNIENIDELIRLNELNLTFNNDYPKITIVNSNPNIESKDAANNCGSGEKSKPSDNDRDRIRLTIGAHQPPAGAGGWSVARCYYLIRPYKKILGIWYWVSGRTMRASIKIALDYLTPGGWDRSILIKTYHDVYASKLEDEGVAWVYFGQTDYNLMVHFGSYDCWASSYSVGLHKPAELKCGTLF